MRGVEITIVLVILEELFFLHRKMETTSCLEKYTENVNHLKLNVLTALEK